MGDVRCTSRKLNYEPSTKMEYIIVNRIKYYALKDFEVIYHGKSTAATANVNGIDYRLWNVYG